MSAPHRLRLLLLTILLSSATHALAQDVSDELDTPSAWKLRKLRVGAVKLRTSLSNDPDTVWIGHIADPSWVPKDRNGNPVPSSARDANGAPTVPGTVPIGGHGPYHVGRGDNRPGGDVSMGVPGGAGTHWNGVWDFDHFQAGDDSLQGWWPVVRPGQPEGAGNADDKVRSFQGFSNGNQGNYVIDEGANKRTFGVTGFWHRDAGNGAVPAYVDGTPAIPGPNVEWAAIAGAHSAWCGLRANDDFHAIDHVSLGGTGNFFNQRVLELSGKSSYEPFGVMNTAGGTDKNFPGYGSQWDQILYRDVDLSGVGVGQTVTISFDYVHALSPVRGGTDLQRIGYFWKDPVRPTKGVVNDGNFVSATETQFMGAGPVDSFTVTLGQPVDIVPDDPPIADGTPSPANDFRASDASGDTPNKNLYDPQRRWFSEVINTGGTGNAPMIELLSRTRFSTAAGGEVDPSSVTPPATASFSTTLTRTAGSSLDALIGSNGGRVRIAFRVLTNRGNDDEDQFVTGFTSHTRGGAIVDNVSITAGGPDLITNGGFEDFGSIDNTVNGVLTNLTEGGTTIAAAVAGSYAGIANGTTVTGQDVSAGTTVTANDGTTITLSAPVRNTLDALASQVGTGQRTVYFGMSTALAAWKSTGKPPGVYVHVHCVNPTCAAPGQWNDPCSPPNLLDARASNRQCNMVGNVLSGGDHSFNEKPGGTFGANDQDRYRLAVSPVIILATDPDATKYNAHGLNRDLVNGSTEWALFFDVHTAGFRGSAGNGQLRSVGFQSYPATQANGATCWGETRWTGANSFHTSNGCIPFLVPLKNTGQVRTSNPSGIPDSIRVHFQYMARCYTTGLTQFTCSPTTGTQVGNYIDNLSFAVIRQPIVAGLSNKPWMWFADAFPTYVDAGGAPQTDFTSASFDTATAKVKSAVNRHSNTASTARPNVPGDSAQVTSGAIPGGGRLDLVFRILPGPGNFTTIGDRLSEIRQVPTALTAAVGNAASTNFWESYMGNTGAFGTGGNGISGVAHDPDGGGAVVAGTRWDWNAWNSARMDTLERNLWPAISNSPNLAQNTGGVDWQTTYHELDPRFGTLGIAKNRCFLASPGVFSTSCKSRTPTSTADCNVVCELLPGAAPFGVFPPAWTAGAGYVAENGLPLGQTYEFTKIIPDGQLTPGSHVQYFFRRSPGALQAIDIWPDTTQIFDGSSADGARWFHFSVLPDRWKDAAYEGEGLLCMLVVDNYDRQGDEFYWVSAADSIGLTSSDKRGAHNGWFAAGGQNVGNTFSQATLRRDNGGQPGTTWDLWNTKAGESITTGSAWLSNRWTTQPPAGSFMDGKQNTTGPTGPMLRHFYRALVYLTGTGNGYIFGAVPDRGDDDIAQVNDFAAGAGSRSVLIWGSGFAENLTGAAGAPIPTGGLAFLNSFFGANLVHADYRTHSGNLVPVAAYDEAPGSAHDLAGTVSGLTYGVSDGCGIQNDVLSANTVSAPTATLQTYYQNYGTNGPYGASVYVPSGTGHPQYTLLDGTRIQRVGSYSPVPPLGRRNFLWNVLKNVQITSGGSCTALSSPVGVGDDPVTAGGFNSLRLRSSNPMRGEARLWFALARTERVEVRVFDVTGRLVKTVARRVFPAGQEHVVLWNGTDESGNQVRSGIYFYRIATPSWTSERKLTVLSN